MTSRSYMIASSNMDPQSNSPLFSLPGELRNEIYKLSMTPSAPTTNPCWNTTIAPPKHQEIPRLAVALLRTCRYIYQEVDSSTILKDNDFVFTQVFHAHEFLSRLTKAQCSLIHNITIDLREAASGDVTTQNEQGTRIRDEWLHYLSCSHGAHPMGAWCSDLSTLKSDIPNLKSLCIDLTRWQPRFASTRQSSWKFLQLLLGRLRGLDSFSLKGKCLDSGSWNPRPVPWSLGPWFSPAFSKDESALVNLIGEVVREEQVNEVKVFEWQVVRGVTVLTIRTQINNKRSGLSLMNPDHSFPECGSMLWQEFLDFKSGGTISMEEKKLPVSAGSIAQVAMLGTVA